MSDIEISNNPTDDQLFALGVYNWPIWEKEISSFPWTYDDKETCLFLEGEVVVTPDGGEPVKMGKGDLVSLPKNMSCHWDIKQNVKKHYRFG